MQNNCDGSGPHTDGEVRVLPLGSEPNHGNLILCRSCFGKELRWRVERNRELAPDVRFATPIWPNLEIYGGSDE